MGNMKEYLRIIKNAIFGKDMRGAIHDAINEMHNETCQNTTRQDLLEKKYDEQIKNIAASEVQSAEVVDARCGFDTLGSVIKQKIYHFENVEKMKNCLTLLPGDVCETFGYYEANDGGGARYLIRLKVDEDVEDGGSIHFIHNNLIAKIINSNNVLQFGVKTDGLTDSTTQLQNAINYCNILYGVEGTVIISAPLLIKKENNLIEIDFKKLNIKVNNNVPTLEHIIKIESYDNTRVFGYIKNLRFDGNGNALVGLYIQDTSQFELDHILGCSCIESEYKIDKNGVTGTAVVLANNLRFINGYEYNLVNCKNSVAMYIDCPDSHYEDVVTLGYKDHIILNSLNFMNKIHSWNYKEDTINESCMFKIGAQAVLTDVYADTLQTMFDISGTGSVDCVNPIFFLNGDFYKTTHNKPTPIIVSDDFINGYGRIRIDNGRFQALSCFDNLKLINYDDGENLRLSLLRVSNTYTGKFYCPKNFLDYTTEELNIDTSNVNAVSSISYSEKVITIMNGYSKININATIGSVSTKGSYITIGTITNDLTIQNEKSRVGFIRNNSINTFYPILCRINKNKELQINVPYEISIGETTNTLILPFDNILNQTNGLYN